MESKHGNLYSSKHAAWNFKAVPWRPGRDFSAPTCAACHNARLIDAEGQILAERTHDFGARLWVRIFGLPYSHPQPLSGKTWEIRNSDKMPLPVTFGGKPASKHLISRAGQEKRKAAFARICGACHASSWADAQFDRLHAVCQKTDEAVMAATQIMNIVWQKKIENKTNPFDQPVEQLWLKQWLFYANSVRYAAAMSGPDYAAFKNGYFNLSATLSEMEKFLNLKHKRKRRKK
jgi:cytochrome c553